MSRSKGKTKEGQRREDGDGTLLVTRGTERTGLILKT